MVFMRDFLNSGCRSLRTGWFLAFVLLALPNCMLNSEGAACPTGCPPDCTPGDPECGDGPVHAFESGATPTSAIMCAIPEPVATPAEECASPNEASDANNLLLTQAATALNEGASSSIALDYSASALAFCNGLPKKVVYMGGGAFPDGLTVCLNCGTQIPAKYATSTKACIARCKDEINFGNGFKPANVDAYCEANAKTATNYDKTMCDPRFDGACTAGGGNPVLNFTDPRRTPENVKWINFDPAGIDDSGGSNTIKRIAATTGATNDDFNQGAASAQTIISGDAWVEFETGEDVTDHLSHVLSLRTSSCDQAVNCSDTDPGLNAIGFGISLNSDGNVYVIESVPGPGLTVTPAFLPPYAAHERFRIRIFDNHNDTAMVQYFRFGACTPGPACVGNMFYQSAQKIAYPIRVDSSFREQNATLQKVTLMYIIPQQ
jgi:hypothetical protein